DEALAVGAEAQADDRVRVALEDEDLQTLPGVPQPHRPVLVARRGEALAVGAETGAADPAPVPLEGEDLLSRARIPDLIRVALANGQAPAVGTKAGAVAADRKDLFAIGRIPDLDRPVTGGEAPAVRAEADAVDLVFVTLEGEDHVARRGVPHPHFHVTVPDPLPARRGEAPAVRAEADAMDRPQVPLEGEDLPALLGVPDPHLTGPVQCPASPGAALAVA